MKLINFTIIKLTVCITIGILIAYFNSISVTLAIIATTSCLVITFITKQITQKKTSSSIFGLFAYLTYIFIGVLTTTLHNENRFQNHYSLKLAKINSEKQITFKVKAVLKAGKYNNKYVITILSINEQSVKGKALLHVKKDTLIPLLKTDAVFFTTGTFKDIKKPLNPEQFNYKNYLEKQYIYHQITTSNNHLFLLSDTIHTIYGYAEQLRLKIKNNLKQYHFKTDELAIIYALILGQKQDISTVVYDSYTKAGAIHILAVSGLHVGILLLILNFILQPIERLKHGKIVKAILIVILLWCFAVIAGLSASVVRAVTMFSILTIGMHLKRPTNSYNTLAISAFILFLFKPLFLFDIGFQLSYLAVIAIISIQPLLASLWAPKFIITQKLWQIFTVSVAAQLGVLPISLFYFHQFPGLFLVTNMVIIPCLGIILGLGILVIILSLLNCLPEFLSSFYALIINYLNQFIAWVSKQDTFIIQDISFNIIQLITGYCLIIALVRYGSKLNYKRLLYLLISIIAFQIVLVFIKLDTSNEFLIFHKSRQTVIGQKIHSDLKIYSNSNTPINIYHNYKIENRIQTEIKEPLSPIFKIKKQHLLIIDSAGVYNVKRFHPDYILLTNTPKINLNRMIDSIQPKLVIADGSNYKSAILKWKTTCKSKKIPFHYTGEKGAFILDSAFGY